MEFTIDKFAKEVAEKALDEITYEGKTIREWAEILVNQQPSEDTEVIKVSKGAVKARQGRFVIYDVDWLIENFYTTEEKIYGQPKQPCEDCISREAVQDLISRWLSDYLLDETREALETINYKVGDMPSVTPQTKTGHCKDCKYFEYDSVAKVEGIPLIVAHEICKRWGDGCKTKEDGYCFMFEPQESEESDADSD